MTDLTLDLLGWINESLNAAHNMLDGERCVYISEEQRKEIRVENGGELDLKQQLRLFVALLDRLRRR